jgi:hypothetical protein
MRTDLNFNIIKVTIPWINEIINPEKFISKLPSCFFKIDDAKESAFTKSRVKKVYKYKTIVGEAKEW